MKKTLLLCLLAVISLCSACKKKHEDPCAGLDTVPAPLQVALIFLNKETGENILLSKNIDPETITVTPTERTLIVTATDTELYGALLFHITDSQKGTFKYTVNVPDVGTVTLNYTSVEKETGSACHPTRIDVGDPEVEEYDYTVKRLGTQILVQIKI